MPRSSPNEHPTESTALIRAKNLTLTAPDLPSIHDLFISIGPGLSLVRTDDERYTRQLFQILSGDAPTTTHSLVRRAKHLYCEFPTRPDSGALEARNWLLAHRSRFPAWDDELATDLIEGFGLTAHRQTALHAIPRQLPQTQLGGGIRSGCRCHVFGNAFRGARWAVMSAVGGVADGGGHTDDPRLGHRRF